MFKVVSQPMPVAKAQPSTIANNSRLAPEPVVRQRTTIPGMTAPPIKASDQRALVAQLRAEAMAMNKKGATAAAAAASARAAGASPKRVGAKYGSALVVFDHFDDALRSCAWACQPAAGAASMARAQHACHGLAGAALPCHGASLPCHLATPAPPSRGAVLLLRPQAQARLCTAACLCRGLPTTLSCPMPPPGSCCAPHTCTSPHGSCALGPGLYRPVAPLQPCGRPRRRSERWRRRPRRIRLGRSCALGAAAPRIRSSKRCSCSRCGGRGGGGQWQARPGRHHPARRPPATPHLPRTPPAQPRAHVCACSPRPTCPSKHEGQRPQRAHTHHAPGLLRAPR